MSTSEERATANGNVFMVGTIVLFVGVWVVWSFGPAMVTLGASWMLGALFSSFK